MAIGVAHTGTDAIMYQGRVMQVSTWEDNGAVYLSWGFNNGPGGGRLVVVGPSSSLSDPDVVVAERNGQLYANVVCIDAAGSNGRPQTRYLGYAWNGSGFGAAFDYWLGDDQVRHLVPNLDANEAGLVGIVWQQRVTTPTTVTVSSPALPTYTYTQDVTFDRSFILGSTIDGKLSDCYRYNTGGTKPTGEPGTGGGAGQTGTQVVRFIYGRPVIDPPTGLFEQTLNPDVAISQGKEDNAILSATFIRHYVDGRGRFSIVDKLNVKQTYYQCPKGGAPLAVADGYKEWKISGTGGIGYPRIAASRYDDPSLIASVEVAIGLGNAQCTADSLGNTAFYEIQNYGKFGTWRADPTIVSLPRVGNQFDPHEAIEPVVSYYGGDTDKKLEYIISWTGRDYDDGAGNTSEQDILAASLSDGVVLFAGSQSRVNDDFRGYDQHTASVAGRYIAANYGTVHLYANDARPEMQRKLAIVQAANPGSGFFRPAPGGTGATAPALAQAYPNPFDSAVSVELTLRKGERVQQVTVLDQLGRQVDQLPVAADGPGQRLSWKPAAQLPSGSYSLRVVTNQRTETVRVNRK